MERLHGILNRFVDVLGSDFFRDAEGLELGAHLVGHLTEREYDVPPAELVGQLSQRLPSAEVDVVDRGGVEHEPADGVAALDEPEHLVGEARRVRVEDAAAEAVDDEPRLRPRSRRGQHHLEVAFLVPGDDEVSGLVVPSNVEDERQEDRENDPFLDPDYHDHDRGQQRDVELVLAQAVDLAHAP